MEEPSFSRYDKSILGMRGYLRATPASWAWREGSRPTLASWAWREGSRPTPASWAWREGSRPTPARLRSVGQDSRQQGTPPDPDLNHPNPKIPDARHIGGHRESTIYDGFPRSRATKVPGRSPPDARELARGRHRIPPGRTFARPPKHKQDP